MTQTMGTLRCLLLMLLLVVQVRSECYLSTNIEKYVQEWPKIPKGRTDEGDEYTVAIDDEGVVTVSPGLASE